MSEKVYNIKKISGGISIDPKIAMLSYSTNGSAKGSGPDTMREAAAIVRQTHPELPCDGEMQFDAAFVPEVGQLKFPGSPVAGYANTFIFPEIQSGNIGYKIAQRLGGFTEPKLEVKITIVLLNLILLPCPSVSTPSSRI